MKIKVLKSKNMDKNLIIAIYIFDINLLLDTWFCGPKINLKWSLQDFIGHQMVLCLCLPFCMENSSLNVHTRQFSISFRSVLSSYLGGHSKVNASGQVCHYLLNLSLLFIALTMIWHLTHLRTYTHTCACAYACVCVCVCVCYFSCLPFQSEYKLVGDRVLSILLTLHGWI